MTNRIPKLVKAVCFFAFPLLLASCASDNNGDGANKVKPGVYEVTYTPAAGSPYTQTVYLNQTGGVVTGEICNGFIGWDTFDSPNLYGVASGNSVLVRGGGAHIENAERAQYESTPGLFDFWAEQFDLLVPGSTVELGPIDDYQAVAISFHNSFVGYETMPDMEGYGYDFALHLYEGSITIDTVTPNLTGSFIGNTLYSKHYNPYYPPLPTYLSGSISGTFSLPFSGAKTGTFTATGIINSVPFSVDVSNAYLAAYYNYALTISENGSVSGTYEIDGEEGTMSSVFVSASEGCPAPL